MTDTISDLVRDISFRLHSYTGLREQVTYLTAPMTNTDTLAQVAHGDRVTRGLIEIEDELVEVDSVDSSTVSIFPFGRGQQGTAAIAHDVNAKVTNDPLLPRQSIFNAVVETIQQVSPELFQVKSTDITYVPPIFTYALPSDADRVLRVTTKIPGTTGVWPQVREWSFDADADTTTYTSGKTVTIGQGLVSGYPFRVTYAAPYGVPTGMTDDLNSLGIIGGVREVIVLGAAWRLTENMENSRLQLQTAEQYARQEAVPVGSATNLAKYLLSAFQLRRQEERNRLLALHPMQIHRTR